MKILCGLSKPTSGEVTVSGYDVYKEPNKIKKCIGYMSQKFSLYEDLTVRENIRFYGGIYGMRLKDIKIKSQQLIEKLGLEEAADKLISDLPLGWRQKLAFLVALIHDPEIVFLDEPTSGVDPITRRQFWSLIYEAAHKGVTIFLTTHYMDESEYCDRVSIMVDGRIAALDKPQQLKKIYEADSMNEVFIRLARNKEFKKEPNKS